jgi:hypothetical protein
MHTISAMSDIVNGRCSDCCAGKRATRHATRRQHSALGEPFDGGSEEKKTKKSKKSRRVQDHTARQLEQNT